MLQAKVLFFYDVSRQRQRLLIYEGITDSEILLAEQLKRLADFDAYLLGISEQLKSDPFGVKLSCSCLESLELLMLTLKYIEYKYDSRLQSKIKETRKLLYFSQIFAAAKLKNARYDIIESSILGILDSYNWKASSLANLLVETGLVRFVGFENDHIEVLLYSCISRLLMFKITDRKRQLQFLLTCLSDSYKTRVFSEALQLCYESIGKETSSDVNSLLDWIAELPRLFQINPQATVNWLNSFFINNRVAILCEKPLFDAFMKSLIFLDEKTSIDEILSNFSSRIKIVIRQPMYKRPDVLERVIVFLIQFSPKNLPQIDMLMEHVIESVDFSIFSSFIKDFCSLLCLKIDRKMINFSSSEFDLMVQKFTGNENGCLVFITSLIASFGSDLTKEWEYLLPVAKEEHQTKLLSLALDSIVSTGRQTSPDFLHSVINKYYPAEIEAYFQKSEHNLVLFAKFVVFLFNCKKLSVAEFLFVFGPSKLMHRSAQFSLKDRSQACRAYLEILKHPFPLKTALIDSICPKFSYNFWVRCLFDEVDYGQLACFNQLMRGDFIRKQALQALNLTPTIVLAALDEIDATGITGKDIVEYVLEIATDSTPSSVLDRLRTVCLSKLCLNSWPLILKFYRVFHNDNSLAIPTNLITNCFNTLGMKEFLMELKCFACPWTCLLVIYKELFYSPSFPIKDLLLLSQFYSTKHQQSDIVDLLTEAVKSSIIEVAYRALVLLTDFESITVGESLKAALKRILFKFNLDTVISVSEEDFDFDIPMDDVDTISGFHGSDFAQYIELLPARSIVLISPISQMALAVQSIVFIMRHCEDVRVSLIFELRNKQHRNLRGYLSLFSINI